MPSLIDRTGQKFNRLTFVKYEGNRKWLFSCDCGNAIVTSGTRVATNLTKSCGCYDIDLKRSRRAEKNPNFIDLKGKSFFRLTALEYIGNSIWKFGCSCGNFVEKQGHVVNAGKIKSCGCYSAELLKKGRPKHGYGSSRNRPRIYNIWSKMKARCLNPSDPNYNNYGGRGISICNEWLVFENFLNDMGEPSAKVSIDRINNNEGYCKSNCRWATPKEQTRNYRRNRLFTYKGKTMCVTDWSIKVGLKPSVVYQRINTYKWTVEQALGLSPR